ncbi:ATP-dependent DNA ligase [Rhizobium binae]|uniref:ATP-dependent DNA ligase n=1 Tax=Rhizobium binae TaxID=1138190 RepID=UPI0035C9290E
MTKPPRKPSKPLLGAAEAPLRSRPRRPRDPAEPQLLLDPMPARIDPCLALLKPRPPKGRQWAFEMKWDGHRLAVHIEPTGIGILSNGGHDWTDRFLPLPPRRGAFPLSTAILDGEGVVFDELGRSDFGKPQQSLGDRGGKRT